MSPHEWSKNLTRDEPRPAFPFPRSLPRMAAARRLAEEGEGGRCATAPAGCICSPPAHPAARTFRQPQRRWISRGWGIKTIAQFFALGLAGKPRRIFSACDARRADILALEGAAGWAGQVCGQPVGERWKAQRAPDAAAGFACFGARHFAISGRGGRARSDEGRSAICRLCAQPPRLLSSPLPHRAGSRPRAQAAIRRSLSRSKRGWIQGGQGSCFGAWTDQFG